jgi:hypothetical protein
MFEYIVTIVKAVFLVILIVFVTLMFPYAVLAIIIGYLLVGVLSEYQSHTR